MKNISRRSVLLATGGLAGWAATSRFKANLPVKDGTQALQPAQSPNLLNDASGLSPTPVHKHIILKENADDALVRLLRQEIKDAQSAGRPFNIGAARHSMGAQAIPRDGTAVTFDNGSVQLDTHNQVYRAHAGARWSQVIRALDPAGYSPAVMQSNNDFGVAATFSVNAHGWPVPFGPMGATVKSLRMLLADGTLVTCSRAENADLFNMAMGGYGLVGAIIDLDVEMVKNSRVAPAFASMPAQDFASRFRQSIDDPSVTMAYGRLNVQRATFFDEALLVSYRETQDQSDLPAAAGSGWMAHVASRIYRAQLSNEPMKSFRWWNETVVGPKLGAKATTRNSLINEPVHTLDDRNPDRTDILHEYFIGFDRFEEFLEVCRQVIPASYQEFLNVTLRYVKTDRESVLSYAPVDRIAAVMSFSQELTQRAEADMKRMTQELIDRVTEIGGTYYLPYRPHAQIDQFHNAYSRAQNFAEHKRRLDPELVFRNNLWDSYLGMPHDA